MIYNHTSLSVRLLATCCFALLLVGTSAMAAEVGFANVDLDSAGDPSDPDSDIVAVTYDGPATVFTSFEFSGILSAVIGDTSEEEAFLQVTVTGVPEPSGLILLVAALVSVAGRRRFRC